jgi:hypothetical protein
MLILLGMAAAPAWGGTPLGPDRLYDSRQVLELAAAEPGPGLALDAPVKNPKLAMLFSLLLPGLGEHYLGHTGRAKVFFATEGLIWTSFAVFRVQGAHREDLYREYAEVHAGVSPRDDDDFYRQIGNFNSSDGPYSANEVVRRQARAIYPNNPDAQQSYFDENAYTGDNAWNWSDPSIREQYRDLRSSSLDAFHRSELSIGAAVANRLLSIIDAGILASKLNRAASPESGGVSWQIQAEPEGGRLTLSRAF